ncbi:CHAP domain-containing protein [Candidatus Saccharibacteria bacterium]|nr:CHAP domain-containing protein [Candidatus Saccharibacteria bacterium]MBP9489411.1 CHAP domain-containing protein [Candidatus Saccharibacteria bacterium]MBP9552155.1 CHAP domain-containing protein [Candidatus Saccharibacteria bacterium]
MNRGSHEVEIIQNRHQTTGKPYYKLDNKKLFNKKSIIIYSSAFVFLVALVAFGSNPTQKSEELSNLSSNTSSSVSAATTESKVSSVDKAVEANVVAGLAETANLPVAANVAERSISLSVLQDVSQTDGSINKPQIIDADTKARGITEYTVKDGENSETIAADYGITVQTLKWSNGIKDDVKAGDVVKILPVDGIIHTVADGETIEGIAEKYGSNSDLITTFNDLELGGLEKDTSVIVPSGILPETERPEYEAPAAAAVESSTSSTSVQSSYRSNMSASVGNKYAYGYCTWYAYERRAQIGRPIGSYWGNATSWAASGAASGLVVNRTPAVGAIMQNGGGYGHVAIVESVNSDGSITISEMNGPAGWNVIGTRTISAGSVGSYNYIH